MLGSGSAAGDHHFRHGINFFLPGGHQEYFVTRGVTKHVINVECAINFVKARPAQIRPPEKARIQEQAKLRDLFRRVIPEVFDDGRHFFYGKHMISPSANARKLHLTYKDVNGAKMFHDKGGAEGQIGPVRRVAGVRIGAVDRKQGSNNPKGIARGE